MIRTANGKIPVGSFFLPYGVIAKSVPWEIFVRIKKSLWSDSKLEFHGTAEKYQNHYCFKELLGECYKKDWVAYCKETFNGAQSVINYLGKYTHRIAISNHRIKSMTEATVTYAVKDYKKTKVSGKRKQFRARNSSVDFFNACSSQNVLSESGTMVCCRAETRAKKDGAL